VADCPLLRPLVRFRNRDVLTASDDLGGRLDDLGGRVEDERA